VILTVCKTATLQPAYLHCAYDRVSVAVALRGSAASRAEHLRVTALANSGDGTILCARTRAFSFLRHKADRSVSYDDSMRAMFPSPSMTSEDELQAIFRSAWPEIVAAMRDVAADPDASVNIRFKAIEHLLRIAETHIPAQPTQRDIKAKRDARDALFNAEASLKTLAIMGGDHARAARLAARIEDLRH
jgi:hypothetical protein